MRPRVPLGDAYLYSFTTMMMLMMKKRHINKYNNLHTTERLLILIIPFSAELWRLDIQQVLVYSVIVG